MAAEKKDANATVAIKDGKVIDGRIKLKLFANLEHGDLDQVDAIVLHQTGGDGAQSTLNSYKSQDANGAHFLIDKDGTIYQTALITKKVFHVGKIRSKCYEAKACSPEDQAAIKTIMGGKGTYSSKVKKLNTFEGKKSYPERYPNNEDAIGIEVASADIKGTYEDPTKEQQASVQWLVSVLLQAYNLKTSDIYTHPQVSYKEGSEARNVQPFAPPPNGKTE